MRNKEIAELREQVRGLVLREQQMQAGAELLIEQIRQLREALKDVSRQNCEVGLQQMREKYAYLLAEDL